MSTVLTVNRQLLSQMQTTYPANRKLPAGAVFASKIDGVTITGYKSGKVLFQGPLEAQEAARWGKPTDSGKTSKGSTAPAASDLPANFSQLAVLGSDEVGTGSYFGPLTTAAVFVPRDQVAPLQELGVKDSKQLTDPQIIRLAKQIQERCPHAVLDLSPAAYNQRIQKYNQAQLKALCHNYVLLRVYHQIAPTKPEAVLIDQFVGAKTYFRYLQGQPEILRDGVYFKEKGEQYHVAVAAASILARASSLAVMDDLTAKAGMTLPIGAGVAVDQVAVKLVEKGLDLGDFAKLHFANTKRVMAQVRK